MIPVVLVGALGRMGLAVERAAESADDIRIRARVEHPDRLGGASAGPGAHGAGYSAASAGPAVGEVAAPIAIERLADSLAPGDVVIEFSTPEGCRRAAEACAARGAALVSGTTGLDDGGEAAIAAAARRVAVLRAANFSLGVLALRRVLATALAVLPASWDVEIVERHHRRKVDSPSGTALLLARDAERERGAATLRHGREGRVGPRPAGEIGIHSVRGGTWVGDHAVLLAGDGEWIELRHVAEDRAAFAHGAIAAARFVAQAPPGLYTLDEVVKSPGRAR